MLLTVRPVSYRTKNGKDLLRESIIYIKVTQSPKVLLLSACRYQPDTVIVKVVSDRLMLKNMF